MNALGPIALALLAYPGGLAALVGAWLLGAPLGLPWRQLGPALLPLSWALAACTFAAAPFSPLPGDWQHLAWTGGLATLAWIASAPRPSRRISLACGAMLIALVALAGTSAGWRASDLAAAGGAVAQVAKAFAALTLVLAAALAAGRDAGSEDVEGGVASWTLLLGCWAVLMVAAVALLWPAVDPLPAYLQGGLFALLVVALALLVRLSSNLGVSSRLPLAWAVGVASTLAVLAALGTLGQ
jgi:hypothetical protein